MVSDFKSNTFMTISTRCREEIVYRDIIRKSCQMKYLLTRILITIYPQARLILTLLLLIFLVFIE